MPNDPSLVGDNCIFLEATPNDGGNHSNPTWWNSPDVVVQGAPQGKVAAGANTVNVKVHWKGNCNLPPGTGSVLIDLYVGDPALVMKPNNTNSTKLITTTSASGLTAGNSVVKGIPWNVPASSSGPDGPGHKCLIARCYPDALTPDPGNFYLPDDQHYAQHNICIIVCGGPGAARVPGPCEFDVSTANLSDTEAEEVIIRAVLDQIPTKTVLNTLMPLLQQTREFQRLATVAPRGFGFRLPDFPDAKVRDYTRRARPVDSLGRRLSVRYEAQIRLMPAQFSTFTFTADLSPSHFGDAHIFHLTQVGHDRRVQGGLTLVMVVA